MRHYQLLINTALLALALSPVLGVTTVMAQSFDPPNPTAPSDDGTVTVYRGYTPPPDADSPEVGVGRGTTRGGSQGSADACASEGGMVTALSPYRHVGQTATTEPTLAWRVDISQPMPTEVFVYAVRSGEKVYHTQLDSQPGLNSITLSPANQVVPSDEDPPEGSIIPDQSYAWFVTVFCEGTDLEVQTAAEFEVVTPDPAMLNAINAIEDPFERANQLAEAGLWYDALAAAIAAGDDSDAFISQMMTDLKQQEQTAERNSG